MDAPGRVEGRRRQRLCLRLGGPPRQIGPAPPPPPPRARPPRPPRPGPERPDRALRPPPPPSRAARGGSAEPPPARAGGRRSGAPKKRPAGAAGGTLACRLPGPAAGGRRGGGCAHMPLGAHPEHILPCQTWTAARGGPACGDRFKNGRGPVTDRPRVGSALPASPLPSGAGRGAWRFLRPRTSSRRCPAR